MRLFVQAARQFIERALLSSHSPCGGAVSTFLPSARTAQVFRPCKQKTRHMHAFNERLMTTYWTNKRLHALCTAPSVLTPLDNYANQTLLSLTPSKKDLQDAHARAHYIGGLLCRTADIRGESYHIIGSLVKRTANSPVKDIDLLVLLRNDDQEWQTNGERLKPATVIRRFSDRIQKTYSRLIDSEHISIYKQDHSIGLTFTRTKRVNVDIVPAFKIGKRQRDVWEIPERSTKTWVQTSPRAQLMTLQQLSGGRPHLRKAIRLLKNWRANCPRLPLRSFALEILAEFAVRHGAPPTPMGIVESTLRLIVETKLALPVSLVDQPTPDDAVVIMDSGVSGNNVTAHLNEDERERIVTLSQVRLLALREAAARIAAGQTYGTVGRLRPFFGDAVTYG